MDSLGYGMRQRKHSCGNASQLGTSLKKNTDVEYEQEARSKYLPWDFGYPVQLHVIAPPEALSERVVFNLELGDLEDDQHGCV